MVILILSVTVGFFIGKAIRTEAETTTVKLGVKQALNTALSGRVDSSDDVTKNKAETSGAVTDTPTKQLSEAQQPLNAEVIENPTEDPTGTSTKAATGVTIRATIETKTKTKAETEDEQKTTDAATTVLGCYGGFEKKNLKKKF